MRVAEFTERVAELETLVKSLESQLEEQARDSDEAITKWEQAAATADETARALEQKHSALLEEKSVWDDERLVLKEQAVELQNRLNNMEGGTPEQDELVAKLVKSEEELGEAKASLLQAEDIVKQWEGTLVVAPASLGVVAIFFSFFLTVLFSI